MAKIRLSLNTTWKGKPVKGKKGLNYYNGRYVDLSRGWMPCEDEYERIFDMIAVQGLAVCPLLKEGTDKRCEANFESHSLVMVDIDQGMTLQELLNDELYNKCGAGFYTTPSHTKELHKFRIIFRLEGDITHANDMRHLYNALLTHYSGDPACKDGARLFYGTINATYRECNPDGILPDKIVKVLIEDARQKELERFNKISSVDYRPPSDDQKEKILELLSDMFVGSYPIWRNIGWALKSGGFSLGDFQRVTRGLMNKKTERDAEVIWNDGDDKGQVTMGTIYHILKERYGDDCLGVRSTKAVRANVNRYFRSKTFKHTEGGQNNAK